MRYRIVLCCLLASAQLRAQEPRALDSIVRAFSKAGAFSGSVLVAKEGKPLLKAGYGYADVSVKTANTGGTVYQIGSVTKQFTAAAVMKLQEMGKLSVNDRISKFFPTLKGGDKISIHQLLTHTSGLYNYTDDTAIWYGKLTEKKLVDYLNTHQPNFAPGADMRYCNSGYILCGYIIEKLTRKKYEAVIREWIFRPLGMTHSGFDFTADVPQKATGYYDESGPQSKARSIDSTTSFAAGAVYSTVDDLYKWAEALYNQKLLKHASWAAMKAPHKNDYGYGLVIDSVLGEKRVWHNGGLDGFVSTFYNLPNQHGVVIILSNYLSSKTTSLANALTAALLGKPYELPEARHEMATDSSMLNAYVGTYALAPTFGITISVDNGQLMAQATGQEKFPVYQQKKDFFFYKVVDAQLEFERDAQGHVQSMTLHQNGMHLKGSKIK